MLMFDLKNDFNTQMRFIFGKKNHCFKIRQLIIKTLFDIQFKTYKRL